MLTRHRVAGVAAALFASVGTSSVRATPSLNLPQALADTKALLAAPGGSADIMVLGDSLSSREGSYIYPLTQKLQQHYGNAGPGWQAFSPWTGAGFNSGWTTGMIGDDTAPHHSLDGLWASATAPTGAYFTAQSDHIELQYLAGPGGGTFNVTRQDSSLVQTINTASPTNEIRTFTHDFAPGESPHLLYNVVGNGSVTILGQNNNSGSPGVQVHRAANGGWGVNNFLQRDWTFDRQTSLLGTDLFMVWVGANDPQYDRTQYAAKLNQLVDRLQADVPSAEIVLVGGYDLWYPEFRDRVAAMEDVASARGIGFMSMLEAGGDYANLQSHGWLDPDGIHFSAAGGEHFSQLMYDAFLTDGASLVPEPASAAVLAVGLTCMLAGRRNRRRRRA